MSRLSNAYMDLVRSDYRAYVHYAHEGRWIPGKAVSYLCGKIQKFLQRSTARAYEILILSLPPQHGKSMTVTETLPSWYLGRYPDRRVIEISYSEDFAQLFGRRNRQKIEQFGGLFGVELAPSPKSNTEFEMANNIGGMISRGVMSGVTGRPCDLMIIDDPIKNRLEADSQTYRDRLWDEWENSFKTRLSSGAKVILIQTRWHEDDLAGRIMEREPYVEVINLPCEAEENDPLGRETGAALCPEIGKDDEWLREYKRGYDGGSRAWNALFQGRPSAEQGNIFKRHWWRYYDEMPQQLERIVLSVDAAFKDGDQNDFVAVEVWGKHGADVYLLDLVCERMDFVETVRAIKRMSGKWPEYHSIYVEDKANGSAIISYLRHELRALVAVEPKGGKIARANAVSGIVEGGNVWLPRSGIADRLVEECAAFPTGAHDDMVDAMTQALSRLYYSRSAGKREASRLRESAFVIPERNTNRGWRGDRMRVF